MFGTKDETIKVFRFQKMEKRVELNHITLRTAVPEKKLHLSDGRSYIPQFYPRRF